MLMFYRLIQINTIGRFEPMKLAYYYDKAIYLLEESNILSLILKHSIDDWPQSLLPFSIDQRGPDFVPWLGGNSRFLNYTPRKPYDFWGTSRVTTLSLILHTLHKALDIHISDYDPDLDPSVWPHDLHPDFDKSCFK